MGAGGWCIPWDYWYYGFVYIYDDIKCLLNHSSLFAKLGTSCRLCFCSSPLLDVSVALPT